MKRWISLVLAGCLAAALTGCGGSSSAAEESALTDAAQDETTNAAEESASESGAKTASDFRGSIYDFTAKLLTECLNEEDDGNVMISPLSVVSALSMTADGAAGNTKEELQQLLYGDTPETEWKDAFRAWITGLPQSENNSLKSANSIWYAKDAEEISFHEDFLSAAEENYQAEIMGENFQDDGIADKINSWVDEKTEHLIPEILDEVNDEDVMFLINALSFDAVWQDPYTTDQVSEGTFTGKSGEEQTVDMMSGEESLYLENDQATGFIKQYAEGEYQFAALLPKEGVTAEELIASLNGETLKELLDSPEAENVIATMPKFSSEYKTDLIEALKALGVSDAFDETAADFSAMADFSQATNLYVSEVLHKTYIEVSEQGTKAGAATSVAISETALAMEPKSVVLNRPFVYLILDGETRLPVFAGVVNEIDG